jgi:flagellar protein FlgJ
MTHTVESGLAFADMAGDRKISDSLKNKKELRQACRDFEALFIHKMLQTMRKSIPDNGMLDGGLAEDIYTDMLDQQIAQAAADRESLGIATVIYEEMSKRL